MRERFSPLAAMLICVSAAVSTGCSGGDRPKPAGYVSWGVDEHELFGKSRSSIKEHFGEKLYSSSDGQTLFFGAPDGCSGYTGPTFRLKYENGVVVGVQRVFIGCKETQWGPELASRRDALRFAIAGIKDRLATGSSDKTLAVKLATMEAQLKKLESASGSAESGQSLSGQSSSGLSQ